MASAILLSIRQLKSRWNKLDFLARGDAIADLVKRGISRRALARELDRSEALLRHLQKSADLAECFKVGIRSNQISFRAAVLSGNAPLKSDHPSTSEIKPGSASGPIPDIAVVQSRVSAPLQVTQTPSDAKGWAGLMIEFASSKYSARPADCRQVVREAQSVCRHIPLSRLGIPPIPPGATISFIIENSRPGRRMDAFTDMSRWLAAWVMALIPDQEIRKEAFAIAEQGSQE